MMRKEIRDFKYAFRAEREERRFIEGVPAICFFNSDFYYYNGYEVLFVTRNDKRYYSRVVRNIAAYCNLLYFNYNGLNPETMFWMIIKKVEYKIADYIKKIATIYMPNDDNNDMPRRLYAHANNYFDTTTYFQRRYAGLKYKLIMKRR